KDQQILTEFRTAVLNRMQRFRIYPPQPGQLLGIDPVVLAPATFRSIHQPRGGYQNLMSETGDDFPHPGPPALPGASPPRRLPTSSASQALHSSSRNCYPSS